MPRVSSSRVNANRIELAYETFGDAVDPPLLLIMGLGVPRFGWDDRFCRALVERGLWVIRFDNRDTGESTHMRGAAPPDLGAALTGDSSSASYRLEDMADDAAGLLDALGIESAHVVGASMGGMIAQTLVIRHPERVRSLTSIMATVGLTVGPPRQEALEALLAPPAQTRGEHEQRTVDISRIIGSPGFSFDEDRLRKLARSTWDAGYDADGVARQLLAMLASGDRTEALRAVEVPTVVIHGDSDPLLQPEGGRATAEAIAGTELDVVEGMGHDLPAELYERFADRIAGLVQRAETGVPTAAR
jgi:pimeloyl-ACP methyl ester carboxylesterase